MKRLWAKTLGVVLVALNVIALTACEEKLELVGEPTITVIREDDGEYTAIVQGYTQNVYGDILYRSEATAHFYDSNGKEIASKAHWSSDIMRIGVDDVWRFYIKAENLPQEPVTFEVNTYEDW